MLNCSKAFVYGWAAIRGLIDPLVAQKVTLVGANTCDELKDLVAPDQLLEEFGGTAKRPEVSWPPTIPIKSVPKKVVQSEQAANSS